MNVTKPLPVILGTMGVCFILGCSFGWDAAKHNAYIEFKLKNNDGVVAASSEAKSVVWSPAPAAMSANCAVKIHPFFETDVTPYQAPQQFIGSR